MLSIIIFLSILADAMPAMEDTSDFWPTLFVLVALVIPIALLTIAIIFIISSYYKKKMHTKPGLASLVLSLVGLMGIFLIFLPYPYSPISNYMSNPSTPFYLAFEMISGIISIVLGIFSYWIQKPRDKYGIVSLILGVIIISITSILLLYVLSPVIY